MNQHVYGTARTCGSVLVASVLHSSTWPLQLFTLYRLLLYSASPDDILSLFLFTYVPFVLWQFGTHLASSLPSRMFCVANVAFPHFPVVHRRCSTGARGKLLYRPMSVRARLVAPICFNTATNTATSQHSTAQHQTICSSIARGVGRHSESPSSPKTPCLFAVGATHPPGSLSTSPLCVISHIH